MTSAKTLFEELGYGGKNVVSLNIGAPGPSTLRRCAELMAKATDARLKEEIKEDASLMQYGPPQGDPQYIQQLARFLSAEYGDKVEESNLVTNAGATNGLHVILTVLFPDRCPIFVEELTYHLVLDMLQVDLKFPVVPVNLDNDGLNIDDLRSQIDRAREKYRFPIPDHGYWAALYAIPTFHNPTGRSLSPEKCKQLIDLAHEKRILIITEDVYNLLYYQGDRPPKRLFAYDRERMKSLNDSKGGVVISNATFSKLLTPGLRLGWLEVPPWIRQIWDKRSLLFSGGSLNMYTSGIVAKAIELGWVSEFVRSLRVEYNKRRDVMMETLRKALPDGCRFEIPAGGYFVWLQLPNGVKASRLQSALKGHGILIQEGTKFCLPERAHKFDRCIRLSISYHESDVIARAVEVLANETKAIAEHSSK